MSRPREARTFSGTARFEVRRRLGAGGMGVVYEAWDRQRQRVVALKTLSQVDPERLLFLKREFRTLADLNHPNLVSFYELLHTEDQWLLAMELVEGTDFLSHARGLAVTIGDHLTISDLPTLAQLDGPPTNEELVAAAGGERGDPERILAAARQLAEGLCALHRAGKLHRDLKPTNVLVTPEGRVVILDFGLAGEIAERRVEGEWGMIAGTPGYMSPEQAQGRPTTAASDWYSVGVILFEALTGQLPFSGAPMELLTAQLARTAPAPSALGAEVPEDLDRLCVRLLAGRASERPAGHEVLATLGARSAPRDVTGSWSLHLPGRDRELGVLEEALAEVVAGRGASLLVHGASGIGKSALMRTFLGRLPAETIALQGRCFECESVPFKALDGVVDALSDHLCRRLSRAECDAVLPADLPAMVRLFPVLARVVGRCSQLAVEATEGAELRHRAFLALRALLARLAATRPVVLFIDDVQWSDPDSAALLRELLAPPDAPPVLLLLACRTEDRDSSPIVRALGQLRALEVAPLGRVESRRLLEAALGDHASDALIDRIVAEARGNAFLLGELARQAELVPEGAHAGTLEDALRARVALLSAEARELLEVVALAGRPISQRIARAAAASITLLDADALDLFGALRILRAERLARTHGVREEDPVECYHDRVREGLVAGLSPGRRAALHRALASALETHAPDAAEALLFHWEGAGDPKRATAHAIRAAERAAAALAFDHAADLYERAIALGAPEAGSWERLGDARLVLGEYARAAEAFETARKALAGSGAGEARLLRKRAVVAQKTGRYAAAIALSEQALEGIPEDEPMLRASVEALLSLTCCYAGRLGEGLGYVDAGLARVAAAASDVSAERLAVEAALHRARGNLLVSLGRPAAAADAYALGLALCEASGDRWERSIALFNLGDAYAQAGHHERALVHLEEALAEKTAMGDRWGLAYTWLAQAGVYAARGEGARALDGCDAGLSLAQQIGDPKLAALLQLERARLRKASGAIAEAEQSLLSALELADRLDAGPELIGACLALAALRREQGRAEEALGLAHRAHAVAASSGGDPWIAEALLERGRIHAACGERDDAELLSRRALTVARRAGAHRQIAAAEALALALSGEPA